MNARTIVAAAMLFGLASCTGTFETRPSVILVVAFGDATGDAVALVEDTFSALEPGQTRELRFVPDSRRALPAPAVDVDVVDRSGVRPTALFLLRESDGDSDPNNDTAYLAGFDLRGIDPAAPAEFAEDPRFAFVLANGDGGDAGLLDAAQEDSYCPTRMQVSRDGRFVAVLEERQACGAASFRAIYLVDLERARAGEVAVVASFIAQPSPAGIFLDQVGDLDPRGRELLYWIDPLAGVVAYDIALQRRLDEPVAAPEGVDLDDVVAFGRVLDRLVLVEGSRIVAIDPAGDAEPVVTRSASGLTSMLRDPYAITRQVVLLADDRMVVHRDVTDADVEPETTAPDRVAALEPEDRFVYLASSGRIDVFDLLTFDGGRPMPRPFALPEIGDPAVLTWTRAAAVVEP